MTPELVRLLITALIAGAFLGALPLLIMMIIGGGYSRGPTPPLPPRRGIYQPATSQGEGEPPMPRKR